MGRELGGGQACLGGAGKGNSLEFLWEGLLNQCQELLTAKIAKKGPLRALRKPGDTLGAMWRGSLSGNFISMGML
jgi:hypothetical protein